MVLQKKLTDATWQDARRGEDLHPRPHSLLDTLGYDNLQATTTATSKRATSSFRD